MPGRLQDKIAIITGASSGIGRAIAITYSAEGARVVCADIRETDRAADQHEHQRTTHDTITSNGGQAIFVQTDVTKAPSVEAVVRSAVETYGRLDIMVNNAGLGGMPDEDPNLAQPVWDTPVEWYERTQAVNNTGVFLGIKYASAQMIRQEPHSSGDRGWIINTASILGVVGTERAAAYCASKGAVINLTKAAALDCAPFGIHVNCFGPGYTESSMTEPMFADPEYKQMLLEKHPFRGRLGKPEDLAKACVFLASEDAQWVTGVSGPRCYDETAVLTKITGVFTG